MLTNEASAVVAELRANATSAAPTADVLALRVALDDVEGRIRNGVATDEDLGPLADLAGAAGVHVGTPAAADDNAPRVREVAPDVPADPRPEAGNVDLPSSTSTGTQHFTR